MVLRIQTAARMRRLALREVDDAGAGLRSSGFVAIRPAMVEKGI
jgi:hypothetical protein